MPMASVGRDWAPARYNFSFSRREPPMKVLVAVKRVVDYNVKVRVKPDGSGVDTANVKMSMNPFDEIAVEEAVRLKEKGRRDRDRRGLLRADRLPGDAAHGAGAGGRPGDPGGNRRRTAAAGRGEAAAGAGGQGAAEDRPAGQAGDRRRRQPDRARCSPRCWAGRRGRSRRRSTSAGDRATVKREVDGGLETIEIGLPAVVTADLRLNEPRYATLPNIMKAKKKPMETTSPAALGVDVTPRLTVAQGRRAAEAAGRRQGRGRGRARGQAAQRGQGHPERCRRDRGIRIHRRRQLRADPHDPRHIAEAATMTTLIIADHNHTSLQAATLNTVTAAQKIGGDIHVLVAGAERGRGRERSRARLPASPRCSTPTRRTSRAPPPRTSPPRSSRWSRPAAIRTSSRRRPASARTSCPASRRCSTSRRSPTSSVVESADTFVRPIYAGSVLATVRSSDAIKVITVRATGFDAAAATGGSAAIESVAAAPDTGLSKVTGQELSKSERPELTSARIVISGGRGVGSAENFKLLEALAGEAQRSARRFAGRGRRGLRAQRLPGRPDRQDRRAGSLHRGRAFPARSSTWPG